MALRIRVRHRSLLPLAGVFFALHAGAAYARVEVNVTHVGFPSILRGDVVRAGSWMPIIVDVALTNDANFDGTIRVAQPDGDGDECYDSVELHLRADSGGGTRRVFLYALANPARNRNRVQVEVRGEDGEAVEVVSQGVLTFAATAADPPDSLPDDDLLVLSLADGAVTRVSELGGEAVRDKFHHPVHVAHMSPTDLPELWLGLDAVDYIVWDEANPDELTPRQLEALMDWTRHGGTLLIAASRTAGTLKQNKRLEPLLPVEIGEVSSIDTLPEFRLALFDPPRTDAEAKGDAEAKVDVAAVWNSVPFTSPVPIVARTPRPDALLIRGDAGFSSDIITRRRLERGEIVFSAITLRDLFSVPSGVGKFFKNVFQLRGVDNPANTRAMPRSLFGSVVSKVGFSTSGSFYLLVAALFSIAYTLAATVGTWKILSFRGWRHHSWSAFAVVAIVASFVSLMGVGWMRGLGDRVHQLAIVDADAGSSYAAGTAFFGLKTALDKEVDVWMPSDWTSASEPAASPCFLRPLPQGNEVDDSESSFADPEEYRLVPGAAMIDDVRIRATLKRFEGRWEGPLGGKLTGQIILRGREIGDESFVVNQLGVDLHDCFLLQAALNTDAVAGGRDQSIYAYLLGNIPSDGAKVALRPRCYLYQGNENRPAEVMIRSQLENKHHEWTNRFRGLFGDLFTPGGTGDRSFTAGAEQDALMLLSTLGDFDADSMSIAPDAWGLNANPIWSRDRMRRMDLRTHLRAGRWDGVVEPGSIMLIGFTPGPGPMRLFSRSGEREFRPLQPEADQSLCMYRIRFPTTVYAAAPEKPVDDIDNIRRGNLFERP